MNCAQKHTIEKREAQPAWRRCLSAVCRFLGACKATREISRRSRAEVDRAHENWQRRARAFTGLRKNAAPYESRRPPGGERETMIEKRERRRFAGREEKCVPVSQREKKRPACNCSWEDILRSTFESSFLPFAKSSVFVNHTSSYYRARRASNYKRLDSLTGTVWFYDWTRRITFSILSPRAVRKRTPAN